MAAFVDYTTRRWGGIIGYQELNYQLSKDEEVIKFKNRFSDFINEFVSKMIYSDTDIFQLQRALRSKNIGKISILLGYGREELEQKINENKISVRGIMSRYPYINFYVANNTNLYASDLNKSELVSDKGTNAPPKKSNAEKIGDCIINTLKNMNWIEWVACVGDWEVCGWVMLLGCTDLVLYHGYESKIFHPIGNYEVSYTTVAINNRLIVK